MARPQPIETLVSQLHDYHTRARARRALAEIGPDAAPALLAVLKDPEAPNNVRWAAMTLLGEWQHEPAMPVLLEIMKSSLNLRGESVRAMQAISGRELGEDEVAWSRLVNGDDSMEETPSADASSELPDGAPDEHVQFYRNALEGLATKVQWEEAGYLYTRIPLPEDRKQQILITFNEENAVGQPLTTFYTECGIAGADTMALVSRRNVALRYGAYHVEDGEEGAKKVVMRHKVQTDTLTPEQAREIVETMARDADAFEFELTQSDHI